MVVPNLRCAVGPALRSPARGPNVSRVLCRLCATASGSEDQGSGGKKGDASSWPLLGSSALCVGVAAALYRNASLGRKEQLRQSVLADERRAALRRERWSCDPLESSGQDRATRQAALDAAEATRRKKLDEASAAREFHMRTKVEMDAEQLRLKLAAADARSRHKLQTTVEANAEALHRKLEEADERSKRKMQTTVEANAVALHLKLEETDAARKAYLGLTVEAKAQALRKKLE